MQTKRFQFSAAKVDYHFSANISGLQALTDDRQTVLITDEHVFDAHKNRLNRWNTIVLKPGEQYKVQSTADAIVEQLIEMGVDRQYTLVGVGGGVITDLTGYVASVYMRGIRFGFVPTTVLSMVDASIGGKNGIDVGVYKNMVGLIRQPQFILFDTSLLRSLPEQEWRNGFAEVIKHACIKDAALFKQLETGQLQQYQRRKPLLDALIRRNALLKTKLVQQDEFETGDRKLLNFGHTLGHAIENMYELSHGQAVSIGMTYACHLSQQLTGFKQTDRVTNLLHRYGLPTYASFDRAKAFEILQKDKKKQAANMSYVLLQRIGKGLVQQVPLASLKNMIENL